MTKAGQGSFSGLNTNARDKTTAICYYSNLCYHGYPSHMCSADDGLKSGAAESVNGESGSWDRHATLESNVTGQIYGIT